MDLLLFFKPIPIVDTTGQGLHVHTEIGTKTWLANRQLQTTRILAETLIVGYSPKVIIN